MPKVCIDENLSIDALNRLRLARWTVPRLVVDVIAPSVADGALAPTPYLPGKLLISKSVSYKNETPLVNSVLIRILRPTKYWATSNPNAIQFRDRWTWAIDAKPEIPTVTGILNGQVGSAIDLGTNTVAEPNPGLQSNWWGTNMVDEWVWPVKPGQKLNVAYRCYVWNPPPYSNNANKNAPVHVANASWARIQLIAFAQQGTVVAG